MENIISNTYPKLFYKFNEKYYACYNIKEDVMIGVDDKEHTLYKHDEIAYSNKPTLEKMLLDISEVEVLNDDKKSEYIEAYETNEKS